MVAASPARLRISLLACALLSLCVAGRAFAFTVPANDGYVTDLTNTLSRQQKADLDAKLDAYRTQTSNQIAVLIVQTLNGEDINQVGVQVGRAWGVGDKQKNNGILLLIALQDRAMAILTGYGLEGAVPDIVAKGIIDTDITPQFRQGKYFVGISAGIDALQKHIGGEYTADRYAQSDGGSPFAFPIVFVFLAINVLGAILGRTRSWWLGGVIGGIAGVILTLLYGWWLSIPGLIFLGLIFDYIVSRMPRGPGGFGGFGGFGGGFGRGGGRGGFGGFGGGSFGGGGASGKW